MSGICLSMKPTSHTLVHYISWSSSLARQRKVPKDLTCGKKMGRLMLRLLQKLERMIREKLAKRLGRIWNRCMYIEYNTITLLYLIPIFGHEGPNSSFWIWNRCMLNEVGVVSNKTMNQHLRHDFRHPMANSGTSGYFPQ
ncbi:hypothetical protein DVH24_035164 [Malus domestica]|uniref:Uncharacterized protein n=1 Tax=Malus domestica TaxID=3750 RepID=A0A498J4H5_MALDO|nr:hypothetical protein DVH24_035164 [Malus domestica]